MTETKFLPLNKVSLPNSSKLQDWLTNPLSMTARFKKLLGEQFQLNVLQETKQILTNPEYQFFNTAHTPMWVREISMGDNHQHWLYGRTVFSEALLAGPHGQAIINLGNKPLGEILFSHSLNPRTELNYALLSPESIEYSWVNKFITEPKPLWARRSLFYLDQHPLLLTEIFLPHCPAYQ